jgi:hypothetical protein
MLFNLNEEDVKDRTYVELMIEDVYIIFTKKASVLTTRFFKFLRIFSKIKL